MLTKEFAGAIQFLWSFLPVNEAQADAGANNCEVKLIKRIAYLNYIADLVINKLTDDDEAERKQEFYYLVLPGYADKTIAVDVSHFNPEQSKFSFLYIPYSQFFNMELDVAVALICHEIAHQVGSEKRLREDRFGYLIQCFAAHLLARAIPEGDVEPRSYETIIRHMAQCVSEFYVNARQWDENDCREPYLESVRQYVCNNSYLVDDFSSELVDINFREEIVGRWCTMFQKLDDDCQKAVREYCCREMYTSMFSDHVACWGIIADYLFGRVKRCCACIADNHQEYRKHVELCDIVMNVFSESYADLCMFQLKKISSFDDYEKINNYNLNMVAVEKNYEDIFRKNAAQTYFDPAIDAASAFNDELKSCGIIIQGTVNDYLCQCRELEVDSLCALSIDEAWELFDSV